MENKRGTLIIFFVAFIIVAAGAIIVIYYFDPFGDRGPAPPPANNQQPAQPVDEPQNNITSGNETSDNETIDVKLRWEAMPVTYRIANRTKCENGSAIENINQAMTIIQDSTSGIVGFAETQSESADLTIGCWDRKRWVEVAGITCKNVSFDYYKYDIHPVQEGGLSPTDIVENKWPLVQNETDTIYQICHIPTGAGGTDVFNALTPEAKVTFSDKKITKATFNIYRDSDGWQNCAKLPVGELHQLLHVLGIANRPEPKFDPRFGWGASFEEQEDIMFPQINCLFQKSVQEKYYSCLKNIYSNGAVVGSCDGVIFLDA